MTGEERARLAEQRASIDKAQAIVRRLLEAAVLEGRHGDVDLKVVLKGGCIVRYHKQTVEIETI